MKDGADYSNYIVPVALVGVGGYVIYSFLQKIGVVDDKKDEEIAKLFERDSPFDPTLVQRLPRPFLILTDAACETFTDSILDADRLFYVAQDQVYSVFQQLKTKSQVSYLSAYFAKNENKSLIDYLRHLLYDNELNRVFQIVNSLPIRTV